MSEQVLPLAEVIQTLREEIADAAEAAQTEEIRFELGPIDLEFTVVAKREGGPQGKIKFSVLGVGAELGAGVKFAAENAQKVKLKLSPYKLGPQGTSQKLEISRSSAPAARP